MTLLISGVAMGSPLFPVLANLKNWLQQYTGSVVFSTFFDDTIYIYANEHDAHVDLDFINSRHPSITFTREQKTEHTF